MPHLASFRKGWENENLAKFILSRFSFIANPSTISDDIGTDIYCTLFQRTQIKKKEYLIPKNSFAIQIKSNKRNIRIKNREEMKYLNNLEFPFFIGVVDQTNLKLSIFSGEYMPFYFTQEGYDHELEIQLQERSLVNWNNYYRFKGEKCFLNFPKIIEIDASIDRNALDRKVEILSSIITLIQENLSSKRIGGTIFKLVQPNSAGYAIYAGEGSFKNFRKNFFFRLAEVYYNLGWICRNLPDYFNQTEYEFFRDIYRSMKSIDPKIPEVIEYAFIEMEKNVSDISTIGKLDS